MNSDVPVAFDILLEEIENTIDDLSQEGTRAFQSRDLVAAGQLAEKGEQITKFRQKIVDLQEEWNSIVSGVNIRERKTAVRRRSKDKKIKRLQHGLRTPQRDYYGPILQSLITLRGKDSVTEVLKLVERSMKSVFNKYDRELLPYDGKPRWEKTTNFARMDMVRLGLLSSNAERGVWEITEKGKRWLAEENECYDQYRGEEAC